MYICNISNRFWCPVWKFCISDTFTSYNLRAFDKRNTGVISRESFTKIMAHRLSKKDIEEIVCLVDESKTGFIEYKGVLLWALSLINNNEKPILAFCAILCENSSQNQQTRKRETKKSMKTKRIEDFEDYTWKQFENELESETMSQKALNKGWKLNHRLLFLAAKLAQESQMFLHQLFLHLQIQLNKTFFDLFI